jgi:ATPase subunit of ABC transporter with duplicated ATPase domains
MSEVLDDERKEAFLLALHSLKEEKEDAEKREEKLRQQQMEQMEERRRESEQKRVEMARMEEETRKQDEERGVRQPKPTPRRTPAKKPSTPPPGLYNRVGGLFAAIQKAIADSAKQMTSNPLAFLRTLLFLIAFSIAFGKRDLRERIMRLVRQAVDKVRRTVGMGVKVSYI